MSPFNLETPHGTIDLREVDAGAFDHMVRDALRKNEWATAAKRRGDMQGIEEGVNRDATQAYAASSKTAPSDKSLLRTIQAGGLWTQDRKFRAGMVETNVCPYCETGAQEDQAHIWWDCPAWQHIRQQFPELTAQQVHSWPPCMRLCGVVPSTFQAPADLRRSTREAQPEVTDLTEDEEPKVWADEGRAGPYGGLTHIGKVVVYTDGACRSNQHKHLRRAGVGAFWAEGHPFNVSTPLVGETQTNNRAELSAVLSVLQLELRAVEVRTDSSYVINGLTENLLTWKRQGW